MSMIRKIVIETDEAVYEILIEYTQGRMAGPKEEMYAVERAFCSLRRV